MFRSAVYHIHQSVAKMGVPESSVLHSGARPLCSIDFWFFCFFSGTIVRLYLKHVIGKWKQGIKIEQTVVIACLILAVLYQMLKAGLSIWEKQDSFNEVDTSEGKFRIVRLGDIGLQNSSSKAAILKLVALLCMAVGCGLLLQKNFMDSQLSSFFHSHAASQCLPAVILILSFSYICLYQQTLVSSVNGDGKHEVTQREMQVISCSAVLQVIGSIGLLFVAFDNQVNFFKHSAGKGVVSAMLGIGALAALGMLVFAESKIRCADDDTRYASSLYHLVIDPPCSSRNETEPYSLTPPSPLSI
jgi:hypothetical protein